MVTDLDHHQIFASALSYGEWSQHDITHDYKIHNAVTKGNTKTRNNRDALTNLDNTQLFVKLWNSCFDVSIIRQVGYRNIQDE